MTGLLPRTSPLPLVEAQPTKTNKHVVFSEQVCVRLTIPRHDISPQDQKILWYSKEDYDEISSACSKQIKKLDRGKILKDKKYCARGLESNTRMASVAKAMNRSLTQKIVFEEQDRQRREGVQEEEYLAYLYHSASSSSQLWANAVGMTDQRAAEEICDDYDYEEAVSSISRCRSIVDASDTFPRSSCWLRRIELARAA